MNTSQADEIDGLAAKLALAQAQAGGTGKGAKGVGKGAGGIPSYADASLQAQLSAANARADRVEAQLREAVQKAGSGSAETASDGSASATGAGTADSASGAFDSATVTLLQGENAQLRADL